MIANHRFSKGEIVCDYHGRVVDAAEGRALLDTHVGHQMGYPFFFKDRERDLCMDAQTFPCPCHVHMETLGRKINHSRKRPNLKPFHVVLDADGEALDVILFRALVDIDVGTELTSGLWRQLEVPPRRRPGSALAGRLKVKVGLFWDTSGKLCRMSNRSGLQKVGCRHHPKSREVPVFSVKTGGRATGTSATPD